MTGAAYVVTLPRKATIDATSPDWSRAWKLDLDGFGFGLSGQVMELDCGGCGANTPQTRRKLAREHVRHGHGTVLPDVTVNGVQLYHATSGRDGFRNDYYGAYYGGQQFQLVFLSTLPYRQTRPIIAATLTTLQLKG
jgi:hypothetical protein